MLRGSDYPFSGLQTATRPLILHFHLFKNGGSTIDSVLYRELDDFFTELHGPEQESILSDADISGKLGQTPSLRAISSHHFRYPKPVVQEHEVFDICVLRHPLDRLFSMYRYLRDVHYLDDPLRRLAKKLTCRDFFLHHLEFRRDYISNVQVSFLSGAQKRVCNSIPLEAAIRQMKEVSFLGTLDAFDESLTTWEYGLSLLLPGTSFSYVAVNRTTSAQTSLVAKLEHFRAACGPDVYRQLEESNREDLILYEAASHEVMERFRQRPFCSEWLSEFRNANRRLKVLEDDKQHSRDFEWIAGQFARRARNTRIRVRGALMTTPGRYAAGAMKGILAALVAGFITAPVSFDDLAPFLVAIGWTVVQNGVGPGIAALAVTTLGTDYTIIEPRFTFSLTQATLNASLLYANWLIVMALAMTMVKHPRRDGP